jgi:hypothetical protein
MADVIVSAHGGRWRNQAKDLIVPKGCEVVFYVRDGAQLDNPTGYHVLAELRAGREPTSFETVSAGEATYDYSCWYAREFEQHCGLYEFGGQGRQLQAFKNVFTGRKPLALSTIFANYRGRVFWDACREVS